MDVVPEQEEQKSILTDLAKLATTEAHQEAGLEKYESLLVKNANDYHELSPAAFRHLRTKLPLTEHLPKPPSLHEYSFLLSRRNQIVTEQFQDHWTAATLAYSAAAENFTQLADLVAEETIPESHPLISSSRTALLAASNVLARALSFYRYLCQKQVARNIRKPGNEKTDVITQSDAKQISQAVETQSKLRLLTQPRGRGRRGRGRGRRSRWHPRRNRGDYYRGQPRNDPNGGRPGPPPPPRT